MTFSYQQPIKKAVRERILSGAVRNLTCDRVSAPIVRPEELEETVDFACDLIKDEQLSKEIKRELAAWLDAHAQSVSVKKAEDLRVLYLCGPEPLNDLEVLRANGVQPANVWAVESVGRNVGLAIKALARSYPEVRFHPGDLTDLLRVYPSRFDIVYYDACGSIFRDDVLDPLLYLLRDVKLEPVSVLITNFAIVPKKWRADCASPLTSYFRYRYNDLPKAFWDAEHLDPAILEHDDTGLKELIGGHFEDFYSDFITRFIGDLARYWIPNCRALALRAISDNYLIENKQLKAYLAKSQGIPDTSPTVEAFLQDVGHMALSPSSYPVLSFYEDLKLKDHVFATKIGNLVIGDQQIGPLLRQASMLDGIFEGHWQGVSKAMLKAIAFSWFDAESPFSCDRPLPNLLVNSLLGIYGHPYFPNPRKCDRMTYIAKKTKMFTDVFLFDQCRYFYDRFPTILLAPYRFKSKGFQVVARCILDRIGRTDRKSGSHPFRGAAVAGFSQIPSADHFDFAAREEL